MIKGTLVMWEDISAMGIADFGNLLVGHSYSWSNYDKIRFTKSIFQVVTVTTSQLFHLHLARSLTNSFRTLLVSAACRSVVSWFKYLGRFLGSTSSIVHPTWSAVIWGEETNGGCMPTRVCLDIVSHCHNRQKDYFEVKGFANGSLFKLTCLLDG